jgi:hypothetical protein
MAALNKSLARLQLARAVQSACHQMMSARLLSVSLLALVACREANGKSDSAPAPSPSPAPAAAPAMAKAEPQSNAALDGTATAKKKDLSKGDQQDSEWVPAEFKQGMSRWKDTGVYVDGKPIGFLTFGELPIALKPTWVKDKVSQNKPADCPECPAWKWAQQRFYKVTDYLKAMGVDIRKVKQIHLYGPKLSQSVVATGKDLQSKRAEQFMFRFGTDVGGKVMPWVPEGFGNGKTPDKISGVMIYIERTPPKVTREGIELDGKPMYGVPYYGEPLRGGVRVYIDDKLATIIKRQELDPKAATQTPDGELHWSFAELLKSKGIDSSKLVEGWVIRKERREKKLAWTDLERMTFTASSQAKGGIAIGDAKLQANVVALHTRTIKQEELPVILPEEEW